MLSFVQDDMEARTKETLLVARAQTGDREAIADLFLMLHPALYGYLANLAGREHAEDLLQETFLQIYPTILWLKEPLALRAWLYRIATRRAFAHLKRERHWTDQIRDESVLATLPSEMNADRLDVQSASMSSFR